MSSTVELGSYVAVYVEGGRYHVDPSHWDELDAAYHHWTERHIDRVLALSCNDGAALLIAASRIAELYLSTPEQRQRSRELAAAEKAEAGFTDEA